MLLRFLVLRMCALAGAAARGHLEREGAAAVGHARAVLSQIRGLRRTLGLVLPRDRRAGGVQGFGAVRRARAARERVHGLAARGAATPRRVHPGAEAAGRLRDGARAGTPAAECDSARGRRGRAAEGERPRGLQGPRALDDLLEQGGRRQVWPVAAAQGRGQGQGRGRVPRAAGAPQRRRGLRLPRDVRAGARPHRVR
eukprot:3895353-Rhodomonas_salina.2